MAGRLEELGREFLEAFRSMNDVSARLTHVRALPPSLSTITFTGRLNVRDVPVHSMRLAAELATEMGDPPEFAVDCDFLKGLRKQRPKAKRLRADEDAGPGDLVAASVDTRSKRFRYQLPLKRNGKSLKVFHNGSVHATGCGSPAEFLEMMVALQYFMETTGNLKAWLQDFDTQLINVLFGLCTPTGHPVNVAPRALRQRLASTLRADLDTERHPSVKFPLLDDDGSKIATVCVFQTGNVSIMGAKRPRHVATAFRVVCEALDLAAGEVCTRAAVRLRTTTAKKPLVLIDGYPLSAYACCQY